MKEKVAVYFNLHENKIYRLALVFQNLAMPHFQFKEYEAM